MPQRWQWYKPHLFTAISSTNNFYTIGRADSEICIIGREKRILTPEDRYSGILITTTPIFKRALKILCIILLLTLPCYWCLTSNIQQRAWKELLGSLYERQDLNNKNEKANGLQLSHREWQPLCINLKYIAIFTLSYFLAIIYPSFKIKYLSHFSRVRSIIFTKTHEIIRWNTMNCIQVY